MRIAWISPFATNSPQAAIETMLLREDRLNACEIIRSVDLNADSISHFASFDLCIYQFDGDFRSNHPIHQLATKLPGVICFHEGDYARYWNELLRDDASRRSLRSWYPQVTGSSGIEPFFPLALGIIIHSPSLMRSISALPVVPCEHFDFPNHSGIFGWLRLGSRMRIYQHRLQLFLDRVLHEKPFWLMQRRATKAMSELFIHPEDGSTERISGELVKLFPRAA